MDSNPKGLYGDRKPPMHLVPPVAVIEEARVMKLGAAKYGPYNWIEDPVSATTYYAAALRHLMAWLTGEDRDAESGCSHLAHARCCMGILLDAGAAGTLIDDRPVNAGSAALALWDEADPSVSGVSDVAGDDVATQATNDGQGECFCALCQASNPDIQQGDVVRFKSAHDLKTYQGIIDDRPIEHAGHRWFRVNARDVIEWVGEHGLDFVDRPRPGGFAFCGEVK